MPNEQISEITTMPTNATIIKIINALIKRYNSLGSIYTFKGSVQTYDDLLIIQNPNVGDVYNVIEEDAEHQVAAGSNFVWDGTVWDNLGGSLAGLVQSVNGINPDSLGNVLLPLIKNVTAAGGNIVFTKNDNSTVQFNDIKKLYMLALGENVNLNDLTESGIYICTNNANAANYENCPIQKAFLLEVQATNNGNFIFQFLTQYNDGSTEAGNQYTRTYYNNNWSAWRMAGNGSNLTTYTSLEQLGITRGQETFASIHNALPINSVLEYYAYVNNNFNDDMYPVANYYGILQAVKLNSTKTTFSFYDHEAISDNEFSELYLSAYDSSFSDSRTTVWNKVLSSETEATQAIKSSLLIKRPSDHSQLVIITSNNRERRLDCGTNYLRLAAMTDEDVSVGGRYLIIHTSNSLSNSLYLQENISGTWTSYNLFGQHNIASQSQAEAGTNNDRPMTPLRVKQAIEAQILDMVYPVGSIYLSTNATNPTVLFGGTWKAYAQGRVLIGAGTGTDSRSEKKTFAAGDTGGEYNHQLTVGELATHSHSASSSSTGAHSHGAAGNRGWDGTSKFGFSDQTNTSATLNTNSSGSHSHTITVKNTGSNAAHNNMQPYLTVYIWQRTA